MTESKPVILALYPKNRGLAYACIETPKNLMEYGTIKVRPLCNERIMKRVCKYMDFFQPHIVITRDVPIHTSRGERIEKLIASIKKEAAERNLPVHEYTRQQIKDVFEIFGASTKYEISKKIIEWFKELAPLAPTLRNKWSDEHHQMGVFDAIALCSCHQYLV